MRLSILALLINAFIFIQCTKSNNFPSTYELQKKDHVKTIDSDVIQLEHKKSGASVVLIKNDDPAKSFMVGFRTPPYDDTGLFHIFEHAVLQGSRLYPSKSNFFHVLNSSVASFINAMTGPVYTLYPYVSRSQEDFDLLLKVYMDAVFFPNVLNNERIVQREGWRYEVDPDQNKININGIVLSEMKGAFSSPYRSVWFQLSRAMVPDTPFYYSSGGLPSKVATLTFDQIKEAHEKYYHPQNSIIYLYGDLDMKKALDTIDKEFLSKFSKTSDYQRPEIPLQTDFNYKTERVDGTYPGQKAPNKDFIAKAYVFGPDLTNTEEDAASVLLQAFIDNPAAPLRLRLVEEKLAQSTFTTGFGGEENGRALVLEGADQANLKKIGKIINEEVEKIVQNGMDQELLTSILNKYEFAYKEKNSNGSHKGMQLGSIVLDNWLFKSQPLPEALDFVAQFKKLRVLLKDQTFIKDFFKSQLQNNNKTRWVVLSPDPDFSKKFNAGLDQQIQAALKDSDLEQFKKMDQEYRDWNTAKESSDILSQVPTLSVEQLNADEKPVEQIIEKQDGFEFLLYPQETSGISYITLFFDLHGVSQENLRNLSLFTSFIERTDSENFGFKELTKEINTYIGGLDFSVSTYQSRKDPNVFKPYMTVSMSFLDENKDKTFELVKELLTNARFAPEQRVQDLIDEVKTNMVSGISYRAPSLSMSAASRGYFPGLSHLNEEISGGVFENYIMNNKLAAKEMIPSFMKILVEVFNQERLALASIIAEKDTFKDYKKEILALKSSLPERGTPDQNWSFENQPDYDGYAIPGEVQYNSLVTSFKDKLEYDGSMDVYARYLNNNFMYPRLREQAGAYGGSASFDDNGLFSMSTYRDPNLSKTFKTFEEAVEFMKNEKWTQEKLTPAILGSLKPYYKDKSVAARASLMRWLYLTDQTWDDYMEIKKEILETTPEKINRITKALQEVIDKSQKGVAGNPDKLKKEANFLKNILSIQ